MSSKEFTLIDLKDLIKKENRTINSVAHDLNVSRQYLSTILNNHKSISYIQLERIYNILGYDLSIIISKR